MNAREERGSCAMDAPVRSLYISHNGMTEPLGQSQVIPYLVGLARRGVEIEILSFEKAGTSPAAVEQLGARLAREKIRWQPMVRNPSHALGWKAWEIGSAALRGLAAALRRRPDIVHARSYVPAAAAEVIASLSPRARLLFDLRGMLGDEYADTGYWSRESLRYRVLKRYERHLLHRSAAVVVLTEALRRWLRSQREIPEATAVEVVPCCVDTERFRVDPGARASMREALGIAGRTVVVYAGSLGTWYMEREMARFMKYFRRSRPDAAMLVLTHADPGALQRAAAAEGLGAADVVVRRVPPAEMPAALAAGDLGLSFILPSFSKMGSSPVKVAEYLAVGLPVVANDQIGDQGELAADREVCVVLPSFEDAALESGARRAAALLDTPQPARAAIANRVAHDRFSLSGLGVPRYYALYQSLCARS